MNDLKTIIADNIIALRKAQGWTQAELAEKLGYSDKAVSKWERAESVPDVAVLKNLADLFGVTVDWLLSTDENRHQAKKEFYSLALPLLSAGLWILLALLFGLFAALGHTLWVIPAAGLPAQAVLLWFFLRKK